MTRRRLCLAAVLLVGGAIANRPASAQAPRRIIPLAGVHYGPPLKWSFTAGAALRRERANGNPFVLLEPGIGGWRASLGYMEVRESFGAWSLRGTFLRTGKHPWRAPTHTSFAGGELQVTPGLLMGLRVGVFARVSPGTGKRGLLTADLNVLF